MPSRLLQGVKRRFRNGARHALSDLFRQSEKASPPPVSDLQNLPDLGPPDNGYNVPERDGEPDSPFCQRKLLPVSAFC